MKSITISLGSSEIQLISYLLPLVVVPWCTWYRCVQFISCIHVYVYNIYIRTDPTRDQSSRRIEFEKFSLKQTAIYIIIIIIGIY